MMRASHTNPAVPPGADHVPRWRRTRYAVALILGVAVAVDGYFTSFTNLSTYAAKNNFPVPPGLPLGLDFGIPALLLLDSLRPSAYLRWAAWTLAAGTVAANVVVTPGDSVTSAVLHGVMPATAVLFFETARHLHDDASRMDRVRISRYLVSPVRTVRLRVRMVRWELTSYADALWLESAILHARAVLIAEYRQRHWRRTRRLVPVTLTHQLATGQLPDLLTFGPGWQSAVRDWVRATLDELDPARGADPDAAAGSGADPIGDSDADEPDPWDLIWVHRDRLRPEGTRADVFAQAIGLARDTFEQVGRHITIDGLRTQLRIGKPAASAIVNVLRSAYESGPDRAVAGPDPAPPTSTATASPDGARSDPAGPGGPNNDIPAATGAAT